MLIAIKNRGKCSMKKETDETSSVDVPGGAWRGGKGLPDGLPVGAYPRTAGPTPTQGSRVIRVPFPPGRHAALILGLALVTLMPGLTSLGQQPTTTSQPNVRISALYVNGVAPGYRPTIGAGLTVNLGPGTAFCGGQVQSYAGGSLALAANATNYVYLDPTVSCAPATNTSGFTSTTIPLATVQTSGSSVSAVSDVRTSFASVGGGGAGSATGGNGAVQFDSNGALAGDATNFYYNSTSHNLTLTGAATANSFQTTGTGAGSTQWTSGALTPSASGTVLCGASAASNFSCSDNAGAVTAMAMIAGDLGGVQGGEQVNALHLVAEGQLGNQVLSTTLPNDATTGTILNTLAKLNSSGQAVIAATTDTSGVVGIAVGGAGTTGSARIGLVGQNLCVFDGATTAGHYAQISPTIAGDCHDAGATVPASGEIIGRVLSTNAAAGTYNVLLELTVR